MKKESQILFLLLAFLLSNCAKNDDDNTGPEPQGEDDPISENQPPSAFSLLNVMDLGVEIDLMPRFTWNTATDPDGDPVVYDFFLYTEGKAVEAEDKLAMDLNTTSFQLANPLSRTTDYEWFVVAKDNGGKETKSSTFSFSTRNLNVPENAFIENADFSGRAGHTVTFFKDKLWLLGGEEADEIEIVKFETSEDGFNWNIGNELGIGALAYHTTTVFNDTLWIIGGRETANSLSPWIYYTSSEDESVRLIEAPYPERQGHTTAVFNDKIWVMGGADDMEQTLLDVWSSSDGSLWEQASDAEWTGRYGHSTVFFNDKLWVIGGQDSMGRSLNDVWYTTDGNSWVAVTQQNPFPERELHKSIVFDNKIWIVGGRSGLEPRTDIWFSEDGANWFSLSTSDHFSGRISPALAVLNNQLLMIGGFDGRYNNDIWVFD